MLDRVKNTDLLINKYTVNGQWLQTQKTFSVFNPSDGSQIAQLPNCGQQETRQAIEAAGNAFRAWKSVARERSDILMQWRELMLANHEDLSTIMTTEQGKPIAEARAEVTYAASFLRWFAEEGVRAYGDTIPSASPETRIVVNKRPIGVVGIITPWNFPLAMITRKVAPAVAVGCSCVIKPSEFTPLSAIALLRLAQKAGLPDGILNLVCGDAVAIGNELTANQTVRKISFTGSTRVGKLLMKQSAESIKRLSLELGGNAPFIIFDDANMEVAVKAVMSNKFRNAGQTCVCANRIFVHKDIADTFVKKLKKEIEKLTIGDGFSEGVTQGPLINLAAVEKLEQHIKDALDKGAKLETGGTRSDKGEQFFYPTLLSNIHGDSLLNREESFGPLAAIATFSSEDEAIAKANDTEYGLSGYFCTTSLSRAWRVAEELELGIVGINEGIISTEVAPFGGVKQSGLGREGSKYGLDEYLEPQYVLMGLK